MVEIAGAYHYGISHDHIVLLGRKTPDVVIATIIFWCCCFIVVLF